MANFIAIIKCKNCIYGAYRPRGVCSFPGSGRGSPARYHCPTWESTFHPLVISLYRKNKCVVCGNTSIKIRLPILQYITNSSIQLCVKFIIVNFPSRSQYPGGRSPAEIVGSNSTGEHWCLSVVSVVCCQIEVSATSWSLVQRSPTDCGTSLCVI